jgi:hypothetical protein
MLKRFKSDARHYLGLPVERKLNLAGLHDFGGEIGSETRSCRGDSRKMPRTLAADFERFLTALLDVIQSDEYRSAA